MPATAPRDRGAVTCGRPFDPMRSQSAAADRWLSTAPAPQASTAARSEPRRESSGWPTEYTAAMDRMQPSRLTATVTADVETPSATSCPRVTSPC